MKGARPGGSGGGAFACLEHLHFSVPPRAGEACAACTGSGPATTRLAGGLHLLLGVHRRHALHPAQAGCAKCKCLLGAPGGAVGCRDAWQVCDPY